MASERVKFTFPPDLVNTPVIYNMGKQFGVATNIRRANLSHDRGWVILEVVGNHALRRVGRDSLDRDGRSYVQGEALASTILKR